MNALTGWLVSACQNGKVIATHLSHKTALGRVGAILFVRSARPANLHIESTSDAMLRIME